jgi:hypothetical protein
MPMLTPGISMRSGHLTQQKGQHKQESAHGGLESRPVAAHAAGNNQFGLAHELSFGTRPFSAVRTQRLP